MSVALSVTSASVDTVMSHAHSPNYFEALDSWRGICACLVAFFHLDAYGPIFASSFIRNSWLFVDFFFVLSGFVIAWNYEGRLNSWIEVKRFLVLRLARLYPLHLFMLFCLLAYETAQFANGLRHSFPMSTFTGDRSPITLLSNIFLVQSLHIHDHYTWIVPSWSISTEFWTYVIFALISTWFGLRNWMLIIAAAMLPIVVFAASNKGLAVTYDYGLVRCLFGFVVGVLCCRIHKRRSLTANKLSGVGRATALECVVFISTVSYVSLVGRTEWTLFAPFVFGLAVLIFAADAGLLSRVLQLQAFKWLGKRSYSIYLTHYFIITAIIPTAVSAIEKYVIQSELRSTMTINAGENLSVFGRNNLEGLFFYLLMIALTLIFSLFTYRWVEMPGRKWARRLVDN